LIFEKKIFRLNVERLRSVSTKYNYLIEHMELEERDLFEPKLNRIDEVFCLELFQIENYFSLGY
jgi:hypothetical protein